MPVLHLPPRGAPAPARQKTPQGRHPDPVSCLDFQGFLLYGSVHPSLP